MLHLEIPPGDFKGFIFDCDGTLADSMPAHYLAWSEAWRDFKAPFVFDEELFYHYGGRPTRAIVELLNVQYGTSFDPDAISHHKEELFLKHLPTIRPITPVVEFARRVKAEGFPVSIGTGGIRHVIEQILTVIHARDLFEIIITPFEVAHGKPAPDIFLLAADRMGAPPSQCLVFEDGEMGFQAAAAAGMPYVKIDSRALSASA